MNSNENELVKNNLIKNQSSIQTPKPKIDYNKKISEINNILLDFFKNNKCDPLDVYFLMFLKNENEFHSNLIKFFCNIVLSNYKEYLNNNSELEKIKKLLKESNDQGGYSKKNQGNISIKKL